jgi:hypothetical protein
MAAALEERFEAITLQDELDTDKQTVYHKSKV